MGVHDSESLANAQEDLANAYSELGNLTAALLATEGCIDLSYASPGCHVTRALVLLKLGRLQDARAQLAVAEKLVRYLMTTTERDLQKDEFFILRANDLQAHFLRTYNGGVRPKNPKSTHRAVWLKEIAKYRDKWEFGLR